MPTARSVDVQAFLNEHPFSRYQWLVFALCFFIVLLDGFDTAAIGYIAPSLTTEWGIARPALAPVLSAALFGLAFGALSAGPLADRFGRKAILIGSVLVIGAACLASAFAGNLDQLVMLRFVTGLGLGAAMPNAVTLMSEYCPEGRRAMVTNAMFCGFPLGAAFGGFLAAWMIPLWGWRSVLVLGGIAPLVLAAVLLVLLPESVRYMVAHNHPVERIRAVLRRISETAAGAAGFVMTEKAPVTKTRNGIAVVLSRGYLVGSVMLWVAYFMGLVIFYALINWMPILFKDAGLAPRDAALIAALFPLGGVGAVLSGWLMDRFNANRIIAFGFVLTYGAVYAIGQVAGNVGLLVVTVFAAGTIMNTAQTSLPSLAASFYPTHGRATGVAWMLGLGRFGGIGGSFLVAELARRELDFTSIFAIVAVPGLVAALALLVKQFVHPEDRSSGTGRTVEALGH
ncbi:MFS transporter (plasmid) [Azospirillum brasilense]|uniref:MFS transporter n=1 Tax=Azospirillum brasilense TaxID=192 RepID=A0A4D8QPJ9_AZOBR|nr:MULTISPECIES: aromatic acid/H+ symport family MFS transporter [Azospirillum]MDW7555338.1 aromatic acid/H+ symport family MFS transporter [Azospirillum brasilense]MDW7595254.1 aromatic acid/H+ symport family MFS transporter [Azospirillum brasilense]MDW7630408.1 aromatic acid/H+ symport family MFS transporter [Azospirillum brasilense]MDX5949775.1 aromatic acid/H+ symport family MFS transporter [Azospirillum brasilense]OPH16900.1 4-hydroxybenzoate transporter [Azospirillum brasilense]